MIETGKIILDHEPTSELNHYFILRATLAEDAPWETIQKGFWTKDEAIDHAVELLKKKSFSSIQVLETVAYLCPEYTFQ